MQISIWLMLVLWIQSSSGQQNASVADTYMVKDETGRVTCQINSGGLTIQTVTWERRVPGGGQVTVYVYHVAQEIGEPKLDLINRSDYEHFSNGTSRLVIHRVHADPDQANYTCRVDFMGPQAVDTGQVFVIERQPAPSISVTDSPLTEGHRAVFTCTPGRGGETILQYHFRRSDGGTLRGNISQGRLTIDQTVRNDQGNYSCRVRTLAGYSPWSGDVSLEVDYPPDSVSITGYTNGTTLYSDDDVTLTCTAAGGRPHPVSIRWNCSNEGSGDGTEIPGGRQNSFTTKVKKSWHGQLCTCTAWQRRNHGAYTASVFFTVSWPPSGPSLVFDPTLPWLEGNTYRTTCQLSDVGNPASTYSWFKDNQNLQQPPGAANISIPVTKNDHNKEIRCEVQNQHTQNRPQQPVQAKRNLNVQFVPSVSLMPDQDEITKKEDEDLTLECSSDSNPTAQDQHYKWIHQRGGSSVREHPGQKIWVLGPVKKETAGTYTCEVAVPITHPESTTLSGNKQTTLIVQYLHLNTPSPTQEVTEYESVKVTCTADAVPAESVQFLPWLHSNRGIVTPLLSNFSNQSIAVLVFTSIQYYNTGNYTCKAHNDQDPEKMAAQQVRVRYTAKQPDHPAEGKRVFTGLGQDVSLSITVDAYPTSVNFIWYYVRGENITRVQEDERTTIISHPPQSTLNITNITMTDLGNYTVHAMNDVRFGSNFSYLVIPEDGPGPPEIDVTRSFSTAVSVELLWRSSFDGGYPQSFSVHYRQVGQSFMLFRSGIKDQGLGISHHIRLTPLTPGTAYEFMVEAQNAHNGGSTATSNIVQITTLERPIVRNSTTSVQRYGSKAYLTWERPGGVYDTQRIEQHDTTGQRQRRSTSVCTPPSCQVSENLTVDTTSYNVTGLVQGRTYQFDLVLFYKGDEVQRQGFTQPVVIGPSGKHVNAGVIAGAVLGIILGIAVIIFIVLIFLRRRQKGTEQKGSRKLLPSRKKKSEAPSGIVNESHTDAHGTTDTSGVVYAAVQKKKGKGKNVNDAQEAVLQEEGHAANAACNNGKVENDSAVLYAEVVKEKKPNKKKRGDSAPETKQENEGPVLYAAVNKKIKEEKSVPQEKKAGKKAKNKEVSQPQADVYAEVKKVPKKGKGKGKKKGKNNAAGDVYENVTAVYQNMGDGAAAPSVGDDLYSRVETGKNVSNPPPGSDGLTYAAVEFIPSKNKKSVKKESEPAFETSEYAAIDYKRKAAPSETDKE